MSNNRLYGLLTPDSAPVERKASASIKIPFRNPPLTSLSSSLTSITRALNSSGSAYSPPSSWSNSPSSSRGSSPGASRGNSPGNSRGGSMIGSPSPIVYRRRSSVSIDSPPASQCTMFERKITRAVSLTSLPRVGAGEYLEILKKNASEESSDLRSSGGTVLTRRERSNSDAKTQSPGYHSAGDTELSYDTIRTHDGHLLAVLPTPIGEGNSAIVYLCQDQATGKFYVLKKAKEGHVFDPTEVENLRIVNAISDGSYCDEKTIVMELVPGIGVWDFLGADKPTHPLRQLQLAVAIIAKVAKLYDGLPKLHRDLNARNVLLDEFYLEAFLIDWEKMVQGWRCRDHVLGNSLYLPLELREALLQQFANQKEADVVYSCKTEVYSAAMIAATILGLIELPEEIVEKEDGTFESQVTDDITKFEKGETYIYPNLDHIDDTIYENDTPDMVILKESKPYYERALVWLHKATHENPQARPTPEVLLEKLTEILKSYVVEKNYKIRTAMFNVEDYLSLNETQRRTMLIMLYNRYDDFVLVDSGGVMKSNLEYFQVKTDAKFDIKEKVEKDPEEENKTPGEKDKVEYITRTRSLLIGTTVFVNNDIKAMTKDVEAYLSKRSLPTELIDFEQVRKDLNLKPVQTPTLSMKP